MFFYADAFANGGHNIKLNIADRFAVIRDQTALLIATPPHLDDPRINQSTILGHLLLSILHTLDYLNKCIADKISKFHYLGFPRVEPSYRIIFALITIPILQ